MRQLCLVFGSIFLIAEFASANGPPNEIVVTHHVVGVQNAPMDFTGFRIKYRVRREMWLDNPNGGSSYDPVVDEDHSYRSVDLKDRDDGMGGVETVVGATFDVDDWDGGQPSPHVVERDFLIDEIVELVNDTYVHRGSGGGKASDYREER